MSSIENTQPSVTSKERLWLASIILVAVIMYIPTFRFFWEKWNADSQYSLAFLVPFVSGYFTWKKWPEIRNLKRSSSGLGLVLIGIALLMHMAGAVLDVSGPSGVSVLLFLLGGCIYFHSRNLVRVLAFPLAYTIFMIPIPGGVLDMVGFPLQLWASGATAAFLNAIGIDVMRTGVNLSVPGYDFQVAAACSGLSSLVALIGVTAVFAYITRLPVKFKWILFSLSLPIALVANWIRITTIALVGYEWGPNAANNIYHDWSSPILFMVAIATLFLLSWGFEWLSQRRNIS